MSPARVSDSSETGCTTTNSSSGSSETSTLRDSSITAKRYAVAYTTRRIDGADRRRHARLPAKFQTRRDIVRRIILAALGACAVVGVTATASAQSTPPTKEPGKLIVGFDVPAPGFWNGRASGTTLRNPSGFEHSLSLAIAKQLKIPEVEFLRAPFGTLFSPAPRKYDFAFEEVTITAQRKKVVAFSTPYFDANQGVLVSKGTPKLTRIAAAQVPADMRAEGHDRAHLDPEQAAAGQAAARLLGVVDRRVRCGRVGALRRADPRRADRRLPEQEEAGRLRRRGRPDRHERVLRRGPGEGQQVQALPRQGHRHVACQRDDQPAPEEVAPVHEGSDPEIAL